jgi:hypothetical protein
LQPCNGAPPEGAARREVPDGTTLAMKERMADLLVLLCTVGFFGLAWAYVHACERL